jgi:phosphatidylglycerol:prolipoprotein diacylglycerol transferase
MWPHLGPIRTYGIFYLLGLVLYLLVGRRLAKRYGLRRRVWIVAGICYLLGMTVGAKALFDLRHGHLDISALLQASHYMRGGLWGGLLAYFALAVPAVLLLTRARRSALDLVAESLPAPWVLAKLGCFFNGCCHGKPSSLPWAVTFPESARGAPAGVSLHPTQLYEAGVMLVILVALAMLRSDRWRGTKLPWFLVLYGVGRAATDMLRGDVERYTYIGPITLTQLLCLAAAAAAAVLLMTRAVRARPGLERD